jgi:hypothetical protein
MLALLRRFRWFKIDIHADQGGRQRPQKLEKEHEKIEFDAAGFFSPTVVD